MFRRLVFTEEFHRLKFHPLSLILMMTQNTTTFRASILNLKQEKQGKVTTERECDVDEVVTVHTLRSH